MPSLCLGDVPRCPGGPVRNVLQPYRWGYAGYAAECHRPFVMP